MILSTNPVEIMSFIRRHLHEKTIALGGVEIGNIKAAEQANVIGIARYIKSRPVLKQIAVVVGKIVAIAAEFVTSSVNNNVKLDKIIRNTMGCRLLNELNPLANMSVKPVELNVSATLSPPPNINKIPQGILTALCQSNKNFFSLNEHGNENSSMELKRAILASLSPQPRS